MTSSIVRAGVDTWVWSAKPKKNFHSGKWLRVASGDRQGLIRLKSPAPRGATILSATLVLQQVDAVSGTHTITAQRIAESFNVNLVTWDKKPAATGPTATVTKSNPGATAQWEFDVTALLQDAADGQPNYGIKLTSSNTSEIKFFSLNASKQRPYLEVTWTTRPDAPTLLKPAYGAVSSAKPILSCDYTDHSGSTDLIAMQVQIDAAGVFSSGVDWDSGTVNVDTPELDLSTTTYPGLASGATTYWRVRVKDGDGLWSLWSDSAPITRAAKGTLTLVNPGAAPNDFVSEFTPPILWTFTGTQTHFRVKIAPANNTKKLLHDTGKVHSSETAYTLPKRILRDDQSYRVTVQVWDDVDREATSGDPVYVAVSRDFTVAFDNTVDPPSSLTAEAVADAPWVDVTFGRATAPDTWTIVRDGVAIETDLEVGDVPVGAVVGGVQTYVWRDYTARPHVQHSYLVRAEVNGKLSNSGPIAHVTPIAEAIWLVDPDTAQQVILGGEGFDTTQDDNADTYTVIGSTGVVRSVMGLNGLSGSVSGALLRTRDGFDWEDLEATLMDFKGRPADEFRLILGDLNIPVVLGDLKVVPSPLTYPGRVVKEVTFAWWQTDEYPFEVHV